jgi:hypothetical protein
MSYNGGMSEHIERFNEAARYVRIVPTVATGPRPGWRVVSIDGITRAVGFTPQFVLTRAAYWEQYIAAIVGGAIVATEAELEELAEVGGEL